MEYNEKDVADDEVYGQKGEADVNKHKRAEFGKTGFVVSVKNRVNQVKKI